jgi:hypothetical protein
MIAVSALALFHQPVVSNFPVDTVKNCISAVAAAVRRSAAFHVVRAHVVQAMSAKRSRSVRPKSVALSSDRSPGDSAGARPSQYLLQIAACGLNAGAVVDGGGGAAVGSDEAATRAAETIPLNMRGLPGR